MMQAILCNSTGAEGAMFATIALFFSSLLREAVSRHIGLEPASNRDAYTLTTWFILCTLAVVCAALWVIGERTYFVRPLTESHNILLAAANVRDWLTFLV